MASGAKNTAYDLSTYKKRKRKTNNVLAIPKNEINKRIIKSKLLSLMSNAIIFFAGISTVSLIIFNQVQLTEITDKLNKTSKQFEECCSENIQLQMKIKEKLSPEIVENYVKNDLNMNKTNSNQIEYIKSNSGDCAEITQNSENSFFNKILMFFGIR